MDIFSKIEYKSYKIKKNRHLSMKKECVILFFMEEIMCQKM